MAGNIVELKKVADSLMENTETEYDCPSLYLELSSSSPGPGNVGGGVPAQGLEGQEMHSRCGLPLGGAGRREATRGLDGHNLGNNWTFFRAK